MLPNGGESGNVTCEFVQVTHAWQKLPTDRLDIDFIERRRVGLEVCTAAVASCVLNLIRDSLFCENVASENISRLVEYFVQELTRRD